MAVKQHVTESEQESSPESNKISYQITDVIETINQVRSEHAEFSDLRKIDDLCKKIVSHLGNVQIPPIGLKHFEEHMNIVKNFLRDYLQCVFEKDNNCSEIVSGWLKILYLLISNKESVSPAIAIVLEIFVEIDEHHVTNAVNWILSTDKSTDIMILKAVTLLCTWLRTITFAPKLNIWIKEFYTCLRSQQRYDLLMRISNASIGLLFNALIIPIFREKIAPVVILILQTSESSFNIIVPIIPKVLTMLDNEYSKDRNQLNRSSSPITQELIQKVIDVIAILIIAFPDHVNLYDTIHLKCFTLPKHIPLSTGWNHKLHPIIANTNARVGLVNLGNTCYMNSVLQSLVMTKQFSREILLSTIQTPLLAKVQKLLALMLHSLRPELTPRDFLHAARPPGFLPGHQQDSSEFLGYLLETLHEQEKTYIENQNKIVIKSINLKRTNSDRQEIAADDTDDMIEDEAVQNDVVVASGDGFTKPNSDGGNKWNKELMEIDSNSICNNLNNGKASNQPTFKNPILDNTFVQKSFGGRISITHKCLTCNSESQTLDLFRDLQLSFPEYQNSNTNYNVQYLLDCYCRSEKLIDDNKYSCDKCKSLSDGERYINIINAPKNLILTLKYFKYDQKYHTRSKLMHKTELNDIIYLKLDNQTVKYGLYAAVVHSGISMDSGHYYTYAADTPQTWYKFNDSFVSKTTLDDLQNLTPPNTPYILFYQVLGNDAHNTQQQDESQQQCNNAPLPESNEVRLPQLSELPIHLRELVNNDNVSYREEVTGRRQTKDSIRI